LPGARSRLGGCCGVCKSACSSVEAFCSLEREDLGGLPPTINCFLGGNATGVGERLLWRGDPVTGIAGRSSSKTVNWLVGRIAFAGGVGGIGGIGIDFGRAEGWSAIVFAACFAAGAGAFPDERLEVAVGLLSDEGTLDGRVLLAEGDLPAIALKSPNVEDCAFAEGGLATGEPVAAAEILSSGDFPGEGLAEDFGTDKPVGVFRIEDRTGGVE